MATIPTRSFTSIVQLISSGMQGRTPRVLSFAIGKVLRALAEAYAGAALWQQSQALQTLKLTRLSTCYGPDADSFVADYGVITRIGAVAATTTVIFSRNTASGSAPVILVGTLVKTTDGSQSFAVYADSSNPAYSLNAGGTSAAPLAGYTMPPQVTSLLVPVVSVTPFDATHGPGSNGNVAAASISLVSTPSPVGVDNVTNPAPVINGSDAETDVAFKARFRDALSNLSRGTVPAIVFACKSIQTNLQCSILNNQNIDGTFNPGVVSVVVDDGSGFVADTTLALVTAAVRAFRALGVRTGVYRAKVLPVQVQLTLTVAAGYSRQNVVAVLSSTLQSLINGIGLGGGEVDYFKVGSWASAVPGVAKINGLTLNGATGDIVPGPVYTPKCSGVIVN